MKKIYLSTAMMLLSSSLVLGAADSFDKPLEREKARTERVMTAVAKLKNQAKIDRIIDNLNVNQHQFFRMPNGEQIGISLLIGDTWNEIYRQAGLNPKDYRLLVNQVIRTNLDEMIPFNIFLLFGRENSGFTQFLTSDSISTLEQPPKVKPILPITFGPENEEDFEITTLSESEAKLLIAQPILCDELKSVKHKDEAIRLILNFINNHPGAADKIVPYSIRSYETQTYQQKLDELNGNPAITEKPAIIPSVSFGPENEEDFEVIFTTLSESERAFLLAQRVLCAEYQSVKHKDDAIRLILNFIKNHPGATDKIAPASVTGGRTQTYQQRLDELNGTHAIIAEPEAIIPSVSISPDLEEEITSVTTASSSQPSSEELADLYAEHFPKTSREARIAFFNEGGNTNTAMSFFNENKMIIEASQNPHAGDVFLEMSY